MSFAVFRSLPLDRLLAPSCYHTAGSFRCPLLLHGLVLGKTQTNSLRHLEKSSGAVFGAGNFRLIETL
jgi:hypothetical protein